MVGKSAHLMQVEMSFLIVKIKWYFSILWGTEEAQSHLLSGASGQQALGPPARCFSWGCSGFREPVSRTWGTISGLSVLIRVFPGKHRFKYQSSYTLVHTLSSSRIPLSPSSVSLIVFAHITVDYLLSSSLMKPATGSPSVWALKMKQFAFANYQSIRNFAN